MIRVSVRFNWVRVRVIKQGTGIVPCKLLIAASGITVFFGCNITDETPNCHQAHTVEARLLESADITPK